MTKAADRLEDECRRLLRKMLEREPTPVEVQWAVSVSKKASNHWRKVIAEKIAAGETVG